MKQFKKILFFFPLAFFSCNSSAQKHLTAGDSIPSFILKDQDGRDFNVKDHIGKKILVIYFYPKDESAVCTKEACSFRDDYAQFEKAGAMVIGINYGSTASHKAFINNHHLPFTLLSDPENKVYRMFGVKKKLMFTGRETFVVDKSGKIAYTFDSFTNGPEHAQKALGYIKQMEK
ncbi:MAG: peroxiredoxin [Bacteroidetes bacterium]|nr:peroxiredoxin [Bacteroidota bacterium]